MSIVDFGQDRVNGLTVRSWAYWGCGGKGLAVVLGPVGFRNSEPEPCVRKLKHWASRFGYSGLEFIYLHSGRFCEERMRLVLRTYGAGPVGVLAAWGPTSAPLFVKSNLQTVLDFADHTDLRFSALGYTRKGDPIRPVNFSSNDEPLLWPSR